MIFLILGRLSRCHLNSVCGSFCRVEIIKYVILLLTKEIHKMIVIIIFRYFIYYIELISWLE